MSPAKTLRQRIKDGEVLVALRGSLTTSKDQLSGIWFGELKQWSRQTSESTYLS